MTSLDDFDVQPDLADLLDELHKLVTAYVILPTPEAADAVVLFIAATHAQGAWEHATRLVIKSPLKRCGKTRLQEVISETAHRVVRTVNISPAALARSIDEKDPPTLILDEADTVFGPKKQRAEGSEDIRGILNSGHSRGWPYIRWDANKRQPEHCPTFAMAVIGGIGDMPDTIEDRAVVILMRRRAAGETVRQWRSRRSIPPLHNLRERLHACVGAMTDELAEVEPDLPVEDRAADVWEPLVALAEAAGGGWPARARKACESLSGERDPDDATAGERLLADLYDVFGTSDQLFTTLLLDSLHKLDEAPWGDWYGHPLNARDLAKLLRPYGIKSRNVRMRDNQAKGYHRADLIDAWRRYVPRASQASQASQPTEPAGQHRDGNGTDELFAIRPSPDLHKQVDGTDGTDGTDERPNHATGSGLAECIYGDGRTLVRDADGRPAHPSCTEAHT